MGVEHSNFRQLCWSCEHSCSKYDCVWVRTLKKHYKGTKIDKDGYIIQCPKYKHDNLLYNDEEKAKALGITKLKYQSLKSYIKKHDHNCSVAEYLKKQEENKKRKSKLSQKELIDRYSSNKVNYAYKIIRQQKLKISLQEFLEKKYGVKDNEQN